MNTVTGRAVLDLLDNILLASGWVKDGDTFYPRHWDAPLLDQFGMEPGEWLLNHYTRENAMMYEIRFREWQAAQEAPETAKDE